jgi:hypothetical protein
VPLALNGFGFRVSGLGFRLRVEQTRAAASTWTRWTRGRCVLALHDAVVFCLHSELRQHRFSLSLPPSLARARARSRALSLRLHIGVATVPQCRITAQDLLLRTPREHVLSSLHKNCLPPMQQPFHFFPPITQRQSDVAICKSERAQTKRRRRRRLFKAKSQGFNGCLCRVCSSPVFFPLALGTVLFRAPATSWNHGVVDL